MSTLVRSDRLAAGDSAVSPWLALIHFSRTATGVLSDVKAIAETVRRVSPDTLIVLDGVCSVASEEIRMDDWQIDVVRAFDSPRELMTS